MCTKDEIIAAVTSVQHILKDEDWVIFGSAALVLHDIPNIRANDIDILIQETSSHRTSIKETGGMRLFDSKHREKITVDNAEIDITWGLQVQTPEGWIPVEIQKICTINGIRFASLSECERLLRLFGREKDLLRINAIQEFLK